MYQGGKRVAMHREGDDMFIHRSKADVLESYGIDRRRLRDYRKINTKDNPILEIQFYGKKIFLDFNKFKNATNELWRE